MYRSEEKYMSQTDSFADLEDMLAIEDLDTDVGNESVTMDFSKLSQSGIFTMNIDHPNFTPTGNPVLDAYLGVPERGKIFSCHGDPQSGKTQFGIDLVKFFIYKHRSQGQMCKVLYFDTEGGLNTDRLKTYTNKAGFFPLKQEWMGSLKIYNGYTNPSYGLLPVVQAIIMEEVGATGIFTNPDTDSLISEKDVDIAEVSLDDIQKVLNKQKNSIIPTLIIFDSFHQLDVRTKMDTLEKVTGYTDEKTRLAPLFFKQLKNILHPFNITMIMIEWDGTNMTPANPNSPKTVHTGPRAGKYLGNIRVRTKAGFKYIVVNRGDKKHKIGEYAEITIEKSRNAKPHVTVPMVIVWNIGVSKVLTFLEFVEPYWCDKYNKMLLELMPHLFSTKYITADKLKQCTSSPTKMMSSITTIFKAYQNDHEQRVYGNEPESVIDGYIEEYNGMYKAMRTICSEVAKDLEIELSSSKNYLA